MPMTSVHIDEVKKNIRALLISAPKGLSVDDIEHDYKAMLGKPLPFREFKCKNCLEFLKAIPDVVSPSWSNGILILKGIADASTIHIAKLVSRQKPSRSRSRRISKPAICTRPLIVPSYFRANIKELLLSYPSGVLGSALNSAYSRHYGEEINFAKLGFQSMSHLLGSIQDIATIVKNAKGGYRVCAIKRKPLSPAIRQQDVKARPQPSAPSSETSSNCIIPSRRRTTDLNSLENDVTDSKKNVENDMEQVKNLLESKSGVSDGLKEELISALAKRPNGVWAARLPFEYKARFNKELSILSLGFYSVVELASSLPDVFRIERPFNNGDWLLFLAEKSKIDRNITKIHTPESAIGKDAYYSQQTLPEADYVELYVTHVKSPGCFWVQLMHHGSQLQALQDAMRSFYSAKESAQFLMDDSLIKLGQVCVARFPVDHEWYRALITATPVQALVEVFFVDYCNSSQVSKSDVRFMKKEFFQLPPQALKCKLANIKPTLKDKWDPMAAHRLHELTAEKGLVGLVCDRTDDILTLCICDTTAKDDVHINDVLVEEGFAVFSGKQEYNEHVAPPGLNLPVERRNALDQEINLNAVNRSFPDYSIPLNPYSGVSSYGLMPSVNMPPVNMPPINMPPINMPPVNMPPTEPFVAVLSEEKPPICEVLEEKPSDEDLEFMRQVCEELSDETNTSVTVRRLDLPDNKFVHLINFQGKPYVVRPEISTLLWESDLLRPMLRQKKMVVPKEVIAREDNEDIFNDLKRLKVADFGDSDEVKEFTSLYALSTIPGILETFKHPSAELVQRLKEEKIIFEQNPGTYWREDKDDANDGTDDSCQSEPEEELNLEELKLAEQALQFRRKRILRSMMKGELTPGGNVVDEVDEVEKQLANIRDLIIKAEAKERGKDLEDTKTHKSEEEDVKTVTAKDNKGSGGSITVPQNALEEAKSTRPEQRRVRPVGVTRPEVRPTLPSSGKLPQNPSQVERAATNTPKEENQNELRTKEEKTADKQENNGDRQETIGGREKNIGDRLVTIGDRLVTIGDEQATIGDKQENIADKQEKTGNKQQHYIDLVETAKKTIEHISSGSTKTPPEFPLPKSELVPVVSSCGKKLSQYNSQNFNPSSTSHHSGVPAWFGYPAYAMTPQNTFPYSNFPFQPANGLPSNFQFPGVLGQFRQISPAFPDFREIGSYHYSPGLLGPAPGPALYFPWGQNPNVRDRPGY